MSLLRNFLLRLVMCTYCSAVGNKDLQKGFLRREWDSNPRYLAVNTLSKRARSATLTPLRETGRNKTIKQASAKCRQEICAVNSPASDFPIISLTFTGSYSPSNSISLVTAASLVISAPLITPIRSKSLLVSYRPCITMPPGHCEMFNTSIPCRTALANASISHGNVGAFPDP